MVELRSTLETPASPREGRRARDLRRLVLGLLAAFLVLGALNFFGLRMATASASGGGYRLEVRYPRVGRPGIGAPFQIQVQHQGGFEGPVTLAMSSDYLDILTVNSISPDPSQVTTTDKEVIWQFNQPPGDTLTVSVGAEFDPDEHLGSHDATTSVLDNGNPAVQVHYRTWEAP